MNVPKLRFKEFNGEWKKLKLGNIAEKISVGIATSSSQYFTSSKNGVPFIKNHNIRENNVNTKNLEYITLDFDNKNKNKRIKAGDILTARTGYPGLSAVVPKELDGAQTFTTLITRVIPSIAIPHFVSIFINSPQGMKQINGMEAGGAQKNVNAGILQQLNIHLPSLDEQRKLISFYQKIDEKIQLQQEKIDLLKEQKKGYMQKIFSQELRFKNFNQKWKDTKLGLLAEISRGASPRPIQDPKWFDESSNVGWLRISDVTEQNGRIHYLEQKISALGQQKTRVIKEPHLLLSIAATVGKPVINYIPTGVHDGFLIFYNPTFNFEFMFQWLEMFRDNWQKYGQPGSQVNLNSELVKNQEISIPSLEEQEKIAKFLSSFDKKIQLQNTKLELLQKQKQALTQQMFI